MKNKYQTLALSILLLSGTGFLSIAQAADDKMSRAEARQTVEDMSPQGMYNTSKKEAHAAYSEAVSQCRSMQGSDRSNCMKEARDNLQNDLAYAKNMLRSETSVGSSPQSNVRTGGSSMRSGPTGPTTGTSGSGAGGAMGK